MPSKQIIRSIKRIYKDMLQFGESSANQKFTPAELTRILRQFIGNSDIKIITQREKHVGLNQIVVGGCYDPREDESNFASILLYVSYSPKQKKICIRNIDWPQLCVDLIECTGHEIVHQLQFRSRDYDIGSSIFVSLSTDSDKCLEQEYLGNPDEVEAYGFSIATEMYLKSNPKVLTHKHISKSPTFKMYEGSFGADHPVVHELLRFARNYYVHLRGGIYTEKLRRTILL